MRSELTRRSLLKVGGAAATAAATAGLLAACAPSGGGTTADGKTTVRVWSWYTGQKDVFPKVIKAFEKKNPKIKIENRIFGTPDQFLPALTAAVSGGDVPEIFAPHVRAITYGEQGITADLKKDLGDDFLKDFFPSTNQEFTKDGKQYAVGFMAQTFGIFYNPDLLKVAGVDGTTIETWDDLIAAAAKINATGKSTLAFSANPTTSALDFFLPLITQVTDDPDYYNKLDQLAKGYAYTNDEVIKALELQDKIVKGKVFQPDTTGTSGDQAGQMFYSSKSAMMFSGSWFPQSLAQDATPDFVKKYQIMKFPALASGARHWTPNTAGAAWAVSETSKNKEAALDFLRFMYEPDQYTVLMNDSLSMPSTKTAAEQVVDPKVKEMTSWMPDGCPHIPFGAGSTAAGDPLGKLFSQTASPKEVAEQMQAAVLNAKG